MILAGDVVNSGRTLAWDLDSHCDFEVTRFSVCPWLVQRGVVVQTLATGLIDCAAMQRAA